MGPRACLNGRKMSSPPGFDPGSYSPQSINIPAELTGSQRDPILTENFSAMRSRRVKLSQTFRKSWWDRQSSRTN